MKIKIQLRMPSSPWQRFEEWSLFVFLLFLPATIVMPTAVHKLTNLLGYALTLFVCLRHGRKLLSVSLKDVLLLSMVLLAVFSISWAASPEFTTTKVRALLRTTILSVYFAAFYTPIEQRKFISKILVVWGAASLLAALIPGYGIVSAGKHAGNLVGIFSFKNSLGGYMALAAIMSLATLIANKENLEERYSWMHRGVLVVASIMVLLSGSKTSIAALAISLCVVPFYLFSRYSFRIKVLLYLLGAGIGTGAVVLVAANVETIVVDWLGKDLSLTGRLPLWQAIIRQGMERPWLGYGHGGFWNTEYALNAAFENQWPRLPNTGLYLEGMHSHNGFIEIFLQLGLIGLALSVVHFLIIFSRLFIMACIKKDLERLWMLQTLLLMSVVNFSEAGSILEPSNILWVLYVSMSLSFMYHAVPKPMPYMKVSPA